MPVLTGKEFKTLNKVESFESKKDIQEKPKEAVKKIVTTIIKEVKKTQKKFEYYLLHPENGVGDKQNFQDVITLDGVPYNRSCVRGIVKTTEKALVDFLMSKGYQLMEKIEKEYK